MKGMENKPLYYQIFTYPQIWSILLILMIAFAVYYHKKDLINNI